jgi:ABC-2 type transport system permease protein
MILFRAGHFGLNLLLLPLAMVALLTFTSAMVIWVAALNVRYRDTQHLLNLALLVWFWLTPVVYPSVTIYDQFAHKHVFGVSALYLYLANPMADIVMGFQRALYGVVSPVTFDAAGHRVVNPVLFPVGVGWLAVLLASVAAGSTILLLLAWRSFFRLSGDFAEEL